MSFSPEIDIHEMYRKLSVLEEEEPQLQLVWQEETSEIHARVMGEVQIEVLQEYDPGAFWDRGSLWHFGSPLSTRKLIADTDDRESGILSRCAIMRRCTFC